jgi:hypothetical protein
VSSPARGTYVRPSLVYDYRLTSRDYKERKSIAQGTMATAR